MAVTLKSLEYFKKVAESEYMASTAEELYISQSQLSRIISELETFLGVKLFDRVGKGIKLNACGHEFYRYTQQILSLCSEAQSSVREIYLHEAAQLTISANITAYMPSLLSRFKKAMPYANCRQTIATREHLIMQLREGKVDFAICAPAVSEAGLTCRHLRYESAGVIYYDGHWLQRRELVSVNDLMAENIICVTKGFALRDIMDDVCRQRGYHPKYVVETIEPTQMGAYVKAGLGITFLPLPVVEADDWYSRHCVHLTDDLKMDLCLIWRSDRVFNDVDQAFFDTVVNYFDELNGQDRTQKM